MRIKEHTGGEGRWGNHSKAAKGKETEQNVTGTKYYMITTHSNPLNKVYSQESVLGEDLGHICLSFMAASQCEKSKT